MKKSLRLAFGFGMLTASLGLIGCDSGGGGEGLPPAGTPNSVSDQMKKMGTMSAPKKAPAKIGTDTAPPAGAQK